MLAVALHYANYYIVQHGDLGFLTGTGVYWSLAVEEHFYLVFPCLLWLLFQRRAGNQSAALGLLGICALTLAWRCVLWFGSDGASEHRMHVATDTRFDSLLFGCVLALLGNPALDRTTIPERVWKYALLPLGLLGLLIGFAVRDQTFRETLRYTLQGISLVPLFVCAVRYPDWLFMRLLNLRPIAFLGVLSYSLYLTHLFVLGTLVVNFSDLGPLWIAVVGLILSILLSWAIYIVVERPCARLRRTLRA